MKNQCEYHERERKNKKVYCVCENKEKQRYFSLVVRHANGGVIEIFSKDSFFLGFVTMENCNTQSE
jgi:hypothetical protein